MVAITDFISYPKLDAHNHLNLGMRYASYVSWAHFYIPDFPRKLSGLDEMHEIIAQYTRPRCQTARDVQMLIHLSIEDAIADGVSVLEGSIDLNFVAKFDNDIDSFLSFVKNTEKKFSSRIDFKPELGIGKTMDMERVKKWAPVCIESGLFKSMDLYGPEIEDGIGNFKSIFKMAAAKGIKKKAHVGEFSDADSVKRLIDFFELDEVQHGIGAAANRSVMRYLADNRIRCNVCPQSNVMLSAVPSLKAHPIRILVDNGVRVSIGTDDLLFFDRTVSEQCADLVKENVLTEKEVFNILDDK